MRVNSRKAALNELLLSRTSITALAAAAAFVPVAALAQDNATNDEVVVTGTRIPSANAVAVSPVTTIGNVEFDIADRGDRADRNRVR